MILKGSQQVETQIAQSCACGGSFATFRHLNIIHIRCSICGRQAPPQIALAMKKQQEIRKQGDTTPPPETPRSVPQAMKTDDAGNAIDPQDPAQDKAQGVPSESQDPKVVTMASPVGKKTAPKSIIRD